MPNRSAICFLTLTQAYWFIVALTEFTQHHRRQGATRGDLPLRKVEPSAVRGKPCFNIYEIGQYCGQLWRILPLQSLERYVVGRGFSKSAPGQQRTSDQSWADRNLFSVGNIARELKILFRFGVSLFFASSAVNSLRLHPGTGVRTKHPSHR